MRETRITSRGKPGEAGSLESVFFTAAAASPAALGEAPGLATFFPSWSKPRLERERERQRWRVVKRGNDKSALVSGFQKKALSPPTHARLAGSSPPLLSLAAADLPWS